MVRQRLDNLLVARGLAPSRARAQALILAGKVMLGKTRGGKPGQMVAEDAALSVEEKTHPWVSRGGIKLAHAIAHFDLRPEGKICLDVGASTGGFTDVLLHRGAAKVYAVDAGHGQLDWKLRQDPRVVALEKTNARYLTAEHVPEPVALVVCDASFIGLRTLLPACLARASEDAELVALIKPQFEAGRAQVGKGGVVRDTNVHEEVCRNVARWLEEEMGWAVRGVTPSPVTGPKGNVEFLIAAARGNFTPLPSSGG